MKTSGFLVADGSANNQHLHMLFKNYPFKKIIDFRERKREGDEKHQFVMPLVNSLLDSCMCPD